MRSVVIISKRGGEYIATAHGRYGGGYSGASAGMAASHAATYAIREMIRYAVGNPDGGDLLAPREVLAMVPERFRRVNGSENR